MRPVLSATLETALYASDLVAAERFYHGILGLPVVGRLPGRHVFFAVGRTMLLLFDPEATAIPATPGARIPVPTHGAMGPGHFCFAVPDLELEPLRAHLEASAVVIEADFRWPNGARSIYVRDPSGNSVEFADPGLWDRTGPDRTTTSD